MLQALNHLHGPLPLQYLCVSLALGSPGLDSALQKYLTSAEWKGRVTSPMQECKPEHFHTTGKYKIPQVYLMNSYLTSQFYSLIYVYELYWQSISYDSSEAFCNPIICFLISVHLLPAYKKVC